MRGWFNESWRHMMAAKGIKTKPRKYQMAALGSLAKVDRSRKVESTAHRQIIMHGAKPTGDSDPKNFKDIIEKSDKDTVIIEEKPLHPAGTMRDIFKESDHVIIKNERGDITRELKLDGDEVTVIPGEGPTIKVDADTELLYEPWFMDQGSFLFHAPKDMVGFEGKKLKLGVEFDDVKPANKNIKPKKFQAIKKVISGGQSGADLEGVKIAKELGFDVEMNTEKDYKPLFDDIPDIPHKEVTDKTGKSGGWKERRQFNVEDSDATLIFSDVPYEDLSPYSGTGATLRDAQRMNKPVKFINVNDFNTGEIKSFLNTHDPEILNIAGRRGLKRDVLEPILKDILRKDELNTEV